MKSKHKKSKLYWELVKLSEENDRAQRALGYKPLEKPIPYGWNMHYELRADIARREDAWIFEAIIERFSQTAWCKNGDFKHWDRGLGRYVDLLPGFKMINEDYYNQLNPQVQHWFKYSSLNDKVRWGYVEKWYYCDVPDYFYKKVITRNYKTHYKVIDEVLLQEEAELEDRLNWEFYGERWRYDNAPKWYRKTFDKKIKNKTKASIRKALKSGLEEDYDAIDGHYKHRHCANWYWW